MTFEELKTLSDTSWSKNDYLSVIIDEVARLRTLVDNTIRVEHGVYTVTSGKKANSPLQSFDNAVKALKNQCDRVAYRRYCDNLEKQYLYETFQRSINDGDYITWLENRLYDNDVPVKPYLSPDAVVRDITCPKCKSDAIYRNPYPQLLCNSCGYRWLNDVPVKEEKNE